MAGHTLICQNPRCPRPNWGSQFCCKGCYQAVLSAGLKDELDSVEHDPECEQRHQNRESDVYLDRDKPKIGASIFEQMGGRLTGPAVCGRSGCVLPAGHNMGKADVPSNHQIPVKWSAADLDRCEHGRHSTDNCLMCPGGWSTGNLYLAWPVTGLKMPGTEVRIGTTLGGEPIVVTPIREPATEGNQELQRQAIARVIQQEGPGSRG